MSDAMHDAEFSGLTVTAPPAAKNGTHRPANKKNKPAAKAATPVIQPIDAAFATAEIEPIDAPMWPLHTALWLQPEQAPSISAWTGLAIERRHRIPAPDFLHADDMLANRPGAPDTSRDSLNPVRQPEIPESSLEPLGWDPRAICRRQGEQ